MKRIVIIFTVIAMLASVFAVTAGAEPTCQEVTIPRFASMPTFDGVISVEEWGEPTVHVVTDGAAPADDDEVGRNDEYGLLNTFYWFKFADPFVDKNFYYDLWMRWDDSYFYIAAKVNDPDPFSQHDFWTGDTFQFTLDVNGPSSMAVKQKPGFDYKKDPFPVILATPWVSQSVFACLATFYKEREPTLWRSKGDWDIIKEVGGYIGITTTENGDGVTCTNVFEIAVPWKVVAADTTKKGTVNEFFAPKEGDVYGITAMVCCTDCNSPFGWLQWGQGIGRVTEKSAQPRGTRGGSQAMILGAETVTPAADYVTAAETTAPVIEVEKPLTRPVTSTVDPDAEETIPEGGTKVKVTRPVNVDSNGKVIVIVVACVLAAVVVAAVVIIIVRKKKNKAE